MGLYSIEFAPLEETGPGVVLLQTCFWTRVQSLSLDHAVEENCVEVGGEMTELTAEIHNDSQRQASEEGGIFLHVPKCGHWLRDGVVVAYHRSESAA
jgi:hypothetical protein